MPITALQEKLLTVPEACFQELYDFMDFLEYRETRRTGLDEALEELERGDVEYFDTVDDMIKGTHCRMQVDVS